MSLIRLNDVFKSYLDAPVLRNVYFRLGESDRVGLIGANGVGKTTFLRLLLGELQPDSGVVERDAKRISYFAQTSRLDSARSALDEMLSVFESVLALEAELDALARKLESASPAETATLLRRQAAIHNALDAVDGWNVLNRVETVLTKLGFQPEDFDKPIATLSGGWRNKTALARILLEEPQVLLLDEPTNHLDVDAIEFLEATLRKYRGAFVLVSHDRYFLDRVVDRIVEIESYGINEYKGGYSAYVRERRLRLKSIARTYRAEEEALLETEERFLEENRERRRELSRRMRRRLADIKKKSRTIRDVKTVRADFLRPPTSSATSILELTNLSKSLGGKTLIRNFSTAFQKGDKVGVIGPNGCGKTTLLRVIADELEPDAGSLKWGKGASFAYVDQHRAGVDGDTSIKEMLKKSAPAYVTHRQARDFLAAFAFDEFDQRQRLDELSGGERCRLLLAEALAMGANLLLLDEPTNDLDVHMIRVLEQAISDFAGAAVIVTHDRFFLDKVVNSLLIFEAGGVVKRFFGNYEKYRQSGGEGVIAPDESDM